MRYVDAASMSSQQRAEFMARELGPDYLQERSGVLDEFIEILDGFTDNELCVRHPIVHAPLGIASGNFVQPFGYIELDSPTDVYAVVRLGFGETFGAEADDFQLLIVPDDSRELVAYSHAVPVDQVGRKIKVHVNDAPSKGMSAPMSVDACQLMDPPECAAGVPSRRVVGLRGFDRKARPLPQALGIGLLSEIISSGVDRVVDAPSVARRIELGVVNDELVHQPVEGRAQEIQPFTKHHGEIVWEWAGCMQINGVLLSVLFDPALDRIGLYMFGGNLPHFISYYAGSLYSGKEQPQISIHSPQSMGTTQQYLRR